MFATAKKLLLGGLLLSAAVSMGFYTAHAIEYGGLGIFPNASEVDEKNPLTKAWFIYTLDRGEIKKGKVNVLNTGNTAIDLRLYPVDAVTTADGAFAPEPEDKERAGVGDWVSLEISKLSLEAGEAKAIDFTIRVPNGAEVGDHMGAIIAQSTAPPEKINGSGLRIATRVGVRLYVTVPGDIVKKLVFDAFTQEVQDDTVIFFAAFSNKGNVRVRLKGDIEIRNSSGEVVDIAGIPEREVFPQKTITIPIEWHPENLDGKKLKARAVVNYDSDLSLEKELIFSAPYLKKPFTLASVVSTGLSAGVGIGVVLSVLIFAVLKIIRRRKK